MSYSFKVTKDADGARLEEVSSGMLPHVPDGTFSISGHHVAPGYSDTENLGVQFLGTDGSFGFAQASVRAPKQEGTDG